MSDATCKTCPFWIPPHSELFEHGTCRRNAPRWEQVNDTNDSAPVAEDFWCGQHPERDPILRELGFLSTTLQELAVELRNR